MNTTCAVAGCPAPVRSRGWCNMHYQRWFNHGSTDSQRPSRGLSLRDKFNLYVVPSDDPDACWGWRGWLNGGYTRIRHGNSQPLGHRLSYEWAKGDIPSGFTIDHLCRNPRCTNPAHLEAVPSAVNILRGIGPTAINKTKTHCAVGHPLDATNTYPLPHGRRLCRTCKNTRNRQYRLRVELEIKAK